MTDLLANTRDLLNAAYKVGLALDRKFESTDMTPALRQAARQYAATYEGDFDYLVEMRERVAGNGAFLTDGQSKAVLNCLMADARRRLGARAPKAPSATSTPLAPVLAVTPDGRYRVTLDGDDSIALRIHLAGSDSKLAGSRVISTRINGDEWLGVGDVTPAGALRIWRACSGSLRDRVRAAVDVLDNGKSEDVWLVAGLAFAQEGSQCFVCGRDLDTPESLTAGYGPICADKLGLPWGAKAVPASVRLAAAASAAPVVEQVAVAPDLDEGSVGPAACVTGPVAYIPREYVEDPRTVADRERYAEAKATAKTEGRRMTYDEIFGENG